MDPDLNPQLIMDMDSGLDKVPDPVDLDPIPKHWFYLSIYLVQDGNSSFPRPFVRSLPFEAVVGCVQPTRQNPRDNRGPGDGENRPGPAQGTQAVPDHCSESISM